jgi:two-component system, cell cycle sensor histidine kinase and response regulator CckA
MTGKLDDQVLHTLERRFQALRDQIGALPQARQNQLEGPLRKFSQAIASLRADQEAGAAETRPQPDSPDLPDAPPCPASADLTSTMPSGPAEPLPAGSQPEATPYCCDTILHQIFRAIPDLLTVIDRDFNIIMSNWHESDIVPEESRGSRPKCYRVYHHRDRPCRVCHVQKVFATGQPQKTEKINLLDGRIREFIAFPILSESGRVILAAEHVRDVTERRRAEEALKESEGTLRGLIEANPESLFLLDRRGLVLAASQVAAQRLGTSLEAIIGADAFTLVPPEVGRKRAEIFQQVLATGMPMRFEDVRGDFHLDISMTPIFDQGQVVRVAVLAVDISLRKLAEAALQESEVRFRAIFAHTPVGIGMSGLTGRILQTNQALQQMLGYSAEELRNITFQEITHPEDLSENLRLQKELLADKCRYYSIEKRFLRKDGDIVWAHVIVTLLRDALGEPQHLLAAVIDHTAWHRAEEGLRESEERFRLMAETIQDVFWIATPTLDQVIYASPACEQVWGRRCQDLYQNPRILMESIHPEDRDRVLTAFAVAREQVSPSDLEYRIIKPDGVVRWVHDRGFPVRDDQGRVILFTGVATDVTEHKAMEGQLLQAQKMEAVGRLAGGVAHDFNNLLMTITGYGELMRDKVLRDDPLYNHLENILQAGDRAAALIRQLLTFSRQKVIQPQVIDLNQVVLDLDPMLRRLIGEDLDLEVSVDPRPGAVKADPGQMGQIIMNLVVNARDAMLRGGRLTLKTAPLEFGQSRHTRFGLAPPGPYVMLVVQDNGIGMDETVQAHVFEPFFTTKEPGKGTGLGLSTVYGIVKQSGGYLELESSPGAGSAFTIYLPRLEATVAPPKAKIPITAGFRGEETILLVEDEDMLRGLLVKFLRLYGYTVLEARHGGEALLTCERYPEPIHLLVTDVVMPQMSGRELADRLILLRPEMQVVFISGYTEDALVQHGVADLSVSFLQKPFKPIELARRVHAVLHPPSAQ